MNISQIIKYLERKPADKIVPMGFSSPGAYRGDYKCLGVEPTPDISVRDMLFAVRYALGTTYQGLNGGSHMMMPGTKVYLAPYGKTGELITRVSLDEMLSTHDKNGVVHPRTVRRLDAALKAIDVSYCVHHTLFESPMPRAMTIASTKRIDVAHLNNCVFHVVQAITSGEVADGESVGAFVKQRLAGFGYYYVAVCSRGDAFSQTRGETIALGRLLKAQRKHNLSFDKRLPALPSRRRSDAQRHHAIVRAKALAKLRAMFASTNPQCVLRVSASDETTASVISPMKRYKDTVQDVVIGCRTRDGHVATCIDCRLTYGGEMCWAYRDDTAAKPRYADSEETATSAPPHTNSRDDTERDVVIGCGQSLECHTSENSAHFLFCRDCSYTYSDAPDSKCSRYRAVYALISPRRIIRAYEADE